MPDYSVKQYISQSKFWRKNKENEPYTGFVVGLGYASVENIIIGSKVRPGKDTLYTTIPVQRIDYSPEAYVRSLNIKEEHIIKAITSRNSDGTYTVNMGNKAAEQYLTLSSLDDLVVNIKDICNTETLMVKATGYKKDRIIIEEYSIPLRDFSEQYRNTTAEIIQAIDNANSVIGTPVSWLESKWEIKSNVNRVFKKNLSDNISNSLRNNGYHVKSSTINKHIMPKLLKNLSRAGNFIGAITIGGNILVNRRAKFSDIYATSVLIVSAGIPGVGWAIGGAFFAADVVSLITTGKSVGDHIDNAFNGGIIWEQSPEVRNLDYYIPQEIDINQNLREMVIPQDNTKVYLPSLLLY